MTMTRENLGIHWVLVSIGINRSLKYDENHQADIAYRFTSTNATMLYISA